MHMDMTTDFAESHPELLFRDHQMGILPQVMGNLLGWPLNETAKSLIRNVDKAAPMAKDLGETIDFLQWQENINLPRILQQLEEESADIGKRAAKDPRLAEAVNKYTKSAPEMRAHLNEVTAAHKKLLASAKGLKIVRELKDERAAEKHLNESEARVKEVEEKARALRERVGKVVGYAEDLIKDPASYTKILEDAAHYVKDVALDFLLGDVYGPDLKEAKDALEAAKNNLEKIRSSIDIDRIARATDELDAAQATFSQSLESLQAAVRGAESDEHSVIVGLEAMGAGAAAAAKAVESRAETVKNAGKGMELVAAYLELCTAIGRDAHGLAVKYHDYWTRLQKQRVNLQEDPPVTQEARIRLKVQGIAENNESVVEKIEAHAEDERKLAISARSYLKGETYLRLYTKIEDRLHRAVTDM
jgi:hypothetical protein